MFRKKARSFTKPEEGHIEDYTFSHIRPLAKQIIKECKQLKSDLKKCTIRMNNEIASGACSSTLEDLLNAIYPHSDVTKLICNMVTSHVTHKPTPLQVALGVETDQKSQ